MFEVLLVLVVAERLAQAPVDVAPQTVSVELRNGSSIEGELIERTERETVVGVSGGEVRLRDGAIRAVVVEPPPSAGDDEDGRETVEPPSAGAEPGGARARRVIRLELPLEVEGDAAVRGGLAFEVPETWTSKRLAGREIAFTDLAQELLLGVSFVDGGQSLWSMTPRLTREYGKRFEGFVLEHQGFSLHAGLPSWEIEFTYRTDGSRFREVHRFLDLEGMKAVFTFTTSVERFSDLLPHFRRVADGVVLVGAGE